MPTFYATELNRVPVIFRTSTHCDAIRLLDATQGAPVYPLTSVIVTAEGHTPMRLATRDLLHADCPWHIPNADHAERFLEIYRHLLVNLVSFHVSGRLAADDAGWLASRLTCSKGIDDIAVALSATVSHVADYTLLGTYRIRVTSSPDGRMVVGG